MATVVIGSSFVFVQNLPPNPLDGDENLTASILRVADNTSEPRRPARCAPLSRLGSVSIDQMSRLYYPPPVKAVLSKGEESGFDTKQAVEKVAKLIPSEVITGYTGLISLFAAAQSQRSQLIGYGVAFVLGLVLTPVYLNQMAEPGKPKRNHLIVSTFAFAFWSYFTSGRQVAPAFYDIIWASAALIIFTLISGAIPMSK